SSVAEYFPQDDARPTLGINLIEFSGDDEHDVDAQVRAFVEHLRTDTSVERLGHTLAAGDDAVKRVYAMRKRAVGLLGNVQGEARPQPFVEDTAVPPENLAAYIAEFRALLDGHGLNATQLAALARSGVALVGLDPAMTLTYRQEYLKVTGLADVPTVALPQEWLLGALPEAGAGKATVSYRLLPHCTEKTNAPDSGKQWAQVFARRGLRLQVQATGCCGMSG
ncbi:hypothetical protein KPA97_29340, partial [Burkholderia cenocepacia]|nr:hypothetical protein [Burkholderia cenocepacia]